MAVLREAAKGQFKLLKVRKQKVKHDDGKYAMEEVEEDAWELFRRCVASIREGKFSWSSDFDKRRLEWSYHLCKNHLIAVTPIIFTTNGNARSTEIRTWAEAARAYGGSDGKTSPAVEPVKALGLFVAEAGRDSEANIVNALTTPGLPRGFDLVVLSGDTKLFSPVNPCEIKNFQTNPCMEELDVSLTERLINQGFPSSNLLQQCEMAKVLLDYPNRRFYDGQLTAGRGTDRKLTAHVRRKLNLAVGACFPTRQQRESYAAHATDAQARLHWLEMPDADADVKRGSKAIPLHINIFTRKIFPGLQSLFGADMKREVLLLVAYGHALHLYEAKMRKHQEKSKLSDAHYPRAMTIDAAQGQKATMVIIDGSMLYADQLGFMGDVRRSNVAMTRATDFLWIIGGSMKCQYYKNNKKALPPFAALKRELESTGQLHRFSEQ